MTTERGYRLALLIVTTMIASGCFGPYPSPAPARVIEVPHDCPDAPPVVVSTPPTSAHIELPCVVPGARACDDVTPVLCAGEASTGLRWVFNMQRCDLPDCWTPSPITQGGCVAGCNPSTGTCILVPQ